MERSLQIKVVLDVQDIVFQVPLDVQDSYQRCLQFSAARELYRPRELQALKQSNNETSSGFLSQVHADVQNILVDNLFKVLLDPQVSKLRTFFGSQRAV